MKPTNEARRKARLAIKLIQAAAQFTGLSQRKIAETIGQVRTDRPYIRARMAVSMVLSESGWSHSQIGVAFRLTPSGASHSITKGRLITDPAFIDLLAHLRDIAASTP